MEKASLSKHKEEEESVFSEANSLYEQTIDQLGDLLRLFSLEVKMTAKSTVNVLVSAILLGVVAVSFWVGLQVLAWMYLSIAGFDTLKSMIILLAINALLACTLGIVITFNFKRINFNATIRNLPGKPSPERVKMD